MRLQLLREVKDLASEEGGDTAGCEIQCPEIHHYVFRRPRNFSGREQSLSFLLIKGTKILNNIFLLDGPSCVIASGSRHGQLSIHYLSILWFLGLLRRHS